MAESNSCDMGQTVIYDESATSGERGMCREPLTITSATAPSFDFCSSLDQTTPLVGFAAGVSHA